MQYYNSNDLTKNIQNMMDEMCAKYVREVGFVKFPELKEKHENFDRVMMVTTMPLWHSSVNRGEGNDYIIFIEGNKKTTYVILYVNRIKTPVFLKETNE